MSAAAQAVKAAVGPLARLGEAQGENGVGPGVTRSNSKGAGQFSAKYLRAAMYDRQSPPALQLPMSGPTTLAESSQGQPTHGATVGVAGCMIAMAGESSSPPSVSTVANTPKPSATSDRQSAIIVNFITAPPYARSLAPFGAPVGNGGN